jgi:hypothetical protein
MTAALYARTVTTARHSSRVYWHVPGRVLCSESDRAVADNVFAVAEISAPRRFMPSQWPMISESG